MASAAESMHPGVHGIARDTHLCARPWDFCLVEISFPVRLPQCRQTSLPQCNSCLALERRGIAEGEG